MRAEVLEIEKDDVDAHGRLPDREAPGDLEQDPDAARAVVGPHDRPEVVGRVGVVVGERPGVPVGAEEDAVLPVLVEGRDDVLALERPTVVGAGLELLDDDVGGPLLQGLDEPCGAGRMSGRAGNARPELDLRLDEAVGRSRVELRAPLPRRHRRLLAAAGKPRQQKNERNEQCSFHP